MFLSFEHVQICNTPDALCVLIRSTLSVHQDFTSAASDLQYRHHPPYMYAQFNMKSTESPAKQDNGTFGLNRTPDSKRRVVGCSRSAIARVRPYPLLLPTDDGLHFWPGLPDNVPRATNALCA